MISKLYNLLILIIASCTISAYIIAHFVAGMTLPLPWDDEAAFLLQSAALYESGSLVSRYLNDDRPIMWMPPGFFYWNAFLFQIWGFNFSIARLSSAVFMIIAYLVSILIIWRKPLRLFSILLLSLVWLGPAYVVAGNVARMDSMCFAVGLFASYLIYNGYIYIGLSLQFINLLIHPNAAFFVISSIVAILLLFRYTNKRSVLEWVGIAISLSLWLFYLFYVFNNFENFYLDMSYQIARKYMRSPVKLLIRSGEWLPLIIGVSITVYTVCVKSKDFVFISFGLSCLLIYIIGREMWYEIFAIYAYVVGGMWVAWFVYDYFGSLCNKRVGGMHFICIWIIILFHWMYRQGFITGPRNWPLKLSWGWGMQTESGVKYFTGGDRDVISDAVVSRIANLHPIGSRPLRIEFRPRGDGLFFYTAFSNIAYVYYPLFSDKQGDITIVRRSRYTPAWIRDAHLAGFTNNYRQVAILHARDGTEEWSLWERADDKSF